MIYNLDQMSNTKEYVGSAYYGANKIKVYRQKGLLHVYGGNVSNDSRMLLRRKYR